MEQDRYKQNHLFYLIALFSLITSIGLVLFSFYILPFLLFNWIYNVPDFVFSCKEWLRVDHKMTENAASFYSFLLFFAPGLIAALIAYLSSNFIDNQLYGIKKFKTEEEEARHMSRETRESLGVFSRIVLIVILILIAVTLFQWLIYTPPVE